MLIISIPKSASSSLIKSFTEQHGLSDQTKSFRSKHLQELQTAAEYHELKRIHSEFVELNTEVVSNLAESELIGVYKHHFPPTQNNQTKLQKVKKVILLREPWEVIDAYARGDKSGVFPIKHPAFMFCFTTAAWHRKACSIGLLDELTRFVDGWRKHSGDALVIEYRDLIAQPEMVLKQIEDYFGLPHHNLLTLHQERFTREKPVRYTSMLMARLRLISNTPPFTHMKKIYRKFKSLYRKLRANILYILYRNKPYKDFYAAVMRHEAKNDYKRAIGSEWDVIGALQFDFLRSIGLKPEHSLLDVGCGSLRGGQHFIKYLEAGKYTGTDISQEILDAGRKTIADEKLESKKPQLILVDSLTFDELGGATFDFILAQSVFTHMPDNEVEMYLQNVGKVMHSQSVFYATIHEGDTYKMRDVKNFIYSEQWFKDACKKYGLTCEIDRSYKHPRNQTMLKIVPVQQA